LPGAGARHQRCKYQPAQTAVSKAPRGGGRDPRPREPGPFQQSVVQQKPAHSGPGRSWARFWAPTNVRGFGRITQMHAHTRRARQLPRQVPPKAGAAPPTRELTHRHWAMLAKPVAATCSAVSRGLPPTAGKPSVRPHNRQRFDLAVRCTPKNRYHCHWDLFEHLKHLGRPSYQTRASEGRGGPPSTCQFFLSVRCEAPWGVTFEFGGGPSVGFTGHEDDVGGAPCTKALARFGCAIPFRAGS